MKITHFDKQLGEMKIKVDTLDDLWHLEKVLESGNEVEAHSMRTYKLNGKEEKKHVKIKIKAERIEFAKTANRLRILGPIIGGSPEEFIQLGRYHTIEVAEGDQIKVTKQWKHHEINRLKDAEKESKKPKVRIIVLDDEKALTAMLRTYGVEYGPEFRSGGSKKDEQHERKKLEYFGNIMAEVEKHPEKFIIAGPGFTKDNLKSFIASRKPELIGRIIFESVSYAERNGVDELFKRGVIEKIMGEERFEKEMKLAEELIMEIYKDKGNAVYGIVEVKRAAEAFAISKLLVLDEYLRNDKQAEAIVELADKNKADVVIFSSEGDAGAKLKGFGKIAALLRFKLRN
ncbi:mRNA surveillance protein pelota [Candidatus Micrarchaeota archaeon]|nr:mRNA surveillance protein pelota [Candidatus Micrarchaeota archaeon]MBU1166418.1 mRNA surveillance protein pelota [Candidatus Micrarchaeota archaeon]MBU1887467.1 mRNA surveillance protein pelota [Candidatus Micrarchaeota archaeon]